MIDLELYERAAEAEKAQEILTQKVERLERALRALVGQPAMPYTAAGEAQMILDETFPI